MGAHLHVPAVSNLHSTAAARSWIRSVSHPERSLNSGIHWNNEIEPLIKQQVVVVLNEFVCSFACLQYRPVECIFLLTFCLILLTFEVPLNLAQINVHF